MVFRQCMGRAVPIVVAGKNNSYDLDEKALLEIVGRKDIANKKVAIVSVAGAFRKGKSFFLNFIVHYLEKLEEGNDVDEEWFTEDTVLDKFQWMGGSKRDTMGILMWNKPFVLRDKDGDETVVLLMDTQGTFDSNSTVKECATIFALSTMISSLQIFNISQNIQEDDLQHLQLFTQFAKLAKKSGDETPFQSLTFLVRDWQNSGEYSYGYEGGGAFLAEKLKTSRAQPRELREVRKDLSSSFSDLRCCLLPHPGLRIANNNKERKLGIVEDEFKEEMLVFVPSIFDDLEPKQFNGQEITCAQLLQYLKQYVAVFKGKTLPSPKTVYEASVEASNITALEKAQTVYQEAMSKVNTELSSLMEFVKEHETGKTAAISSFTNAARLGGAKANDDFLPRLHAYIQERYSQLSGVIEAREQLQRQSQELAEQERKQRDENERNRREIEEERQRLADEARQQREKEEERRIQKLEETTERLERANRESEARQDENNGLTILVKTAAMAGLAYFFPPAAVALAAADIASSASKDTNPKSSEAQKTRNELDEKGDIMLK